jgi:diaminohydroxyphosphoribosylaminopyrimidine deaminase/5-amino-6-(5-phosphoribosylamino)uracil reductase
MQQFRTDVVQQLASTAKGRSPVAETGGKAPSGRTFPSAWGDFTVQFRDSDTPLPGPWGEIFEPLRCPAPDGLMVVGQVGQSLDGRIATEAGDSHYINKTAGLEHLHRLRSLVDAVLVGVGTAITDDPQLTVRRVEGRNPARVVLDPKGRLPAAAKILNEDDVPCVILTAEGAACASSSRAKVIALPTSDGQIAPAAIRAALRGCGFRRVLVEGGANTLSRFLAAGCLDRLHVVVAPIILGSGRASFTLPPIARVADATPVKMRSFPLGEEVLLDCDLRG